jgi:hypothetical protein
MRKAAAALSGQQPHAKAEHLLTSSRPGTGCFELLLRMPVMLKAVDCFRKGAWKVVAESPAPTSPTLIGVVAI